jgi:4-amino-4-deoxy-L-arabinose transferase-like glycosyltransferase
MVIRRIVVIVLLAVLSLLYFAGQKSNPPGFYVDESSIAYNALTMARHGTDEYGIYFPLYFRAFGEYKNPIFIYALAAVFKVVPPENLIARRLAASAMYVSALVLGLLAWSITRRRWIAAAIFIGALVTPNFFEVGRIAFEVSFFPLMLALFFLAVWRASRQERWGWPAIAAIVMTLVLITYTYSTGRLLTPLLAVGLVLFWTRERRAALMAIWVAVLLFSIVPLIVYNARHHGALTGRAKQLSYVNSLDGKPVRIITAVEEHLALNLLPLGLALEGDSLPRHHVPHSGGEVLLMTFILVAISIAVIVRRHGRDRWWLFVLYAALAAAVPASATVDRYHALRLISYPVVLTILTIPVLEVVAYGESSRWLRALVATALLLGVVQAGWFFYTFNRRGRDRVQDFDGGFRRMLSETLTGHERPIYIASDVYYVHAFWYGALAGVDRSQFAVLHPGDPAPPPHSLVITIGSTECSGCALVSRQGDFSSYLTP